MRRAEHRKSVRGTRLAQARCRFNPNLPAEKTMNDRFWEKRPDDQAFNSPPEPTPAPPNPAPSVDESMGRVRSAADQAVGTVKDTAREAVAGVKDGLREIGDRVKT